MKIDKIIENATYQIELTESEKARICVFLTVASLNGDVLERVKRISSDRYGDGVVETTKEFMALIGDTKAGNVENQKYDYHDKRTGLEWKVWDDIDTDWYGVKEWVNGLGNEWEIPSIWQLNKLYEGRYMLYWKHNIVDDIFPEFKTGKYVWSIGGEETTGAYTWMFEFKRGNATGVPLLSVKNFRGVAVRKHKQRECDYYDKSTNLEWLVGTDKDTDWLGADVWAKSFDRNWRLPNSMELHTLYTRRVGAEYMLTKLSEKGCHIWTYQGGEGYYDGDGYAMNLKVGNIYKLDLEKKTNLRAIAVRYRQ